MKKFLKIFFGVLLLCVFAYTIYFLYQKSQTEPIVYETTTAFISDIIKKTTATGSVVPRYEIEIKPQVSGIIEEIYIEAGKSIKKGDLIAKVKIIPNMVALNNAESRVNRAKINLENAKRNFDRQKELLDEDVIPQTEFEAYKLAYDNAIEELASAQG